MDTRNPKLISIVAKGRELFWKYGIRRVSIEEICKEAGVSKMTFYKFFKNKNSLVIYIMDCMMKDQFEQYRSFWDSDIPMVQKVEKAIHLKLEYTRSISNELVQDIYKGEDEELTGYITKLINDNLEMVRKDFEEAQQKGWIRDDLNINFMFYFINHLTEVITDEKLQSLFPDTNSMFKEIMEFFFYGIMPKEHQ